MSTSTRMLSPSGEVVVEQYCTFWVAGLYFGVDVGGVQEVLRHQPITPVPRASDAVHGLINLRGQIVTAVDLRIRLGLPARAEDELPMNVIVRSYGEVVSLLVDDIGDVIDAHGPGASGLEAPPANLPPPVRDVVLGVRSLPESILLVLDADRAVDVSTVPESVGGNP